MPTFKNHVKAKHSREHAGRLFTYVDSKYTAAIWPQSQVNKSRVQVQVQYLGNIAYTSTLSEAGEYS